MNDKLIGSISKTKEILEKYNITAKKKYGQNFLIEPMILNKIASCINSQQTIIEIGAGIGSLTEILALNGKKVISYEIDEDLIEVLEENLSKYDNVTIYNEDFLKVDLENLLKNLEGEVVVVSNLPYYITSELLEKIFYQHKRITKVVAMMQKEVADRFLKKEKGKDYNIVQFMAEYCSEVSLLSKVSRKNYFPAPNVDSAIIVYQMRKDTPEINEGLYFSIVKAAFSQRRKVLLSNLHNNNIEISADELARINLTGQERIEQLSIEDFLKIYEVISHEG